MYYKGALFLSMLSGQLWLSLLLITWLSVMSWKKQERLLGSQLPELIYSALMVHCLDLGNQT